MSLKAEASAIYVGEVFHQRKVQRDHQFRYKVFYLLMDLDRGEELGQRSRWFGWNKKAVLAFFESDHGKANDVPLRTQFDEMLHAHGFAPARRRYLLLTMPRVFGYVFNPLSIAYCYSETGQLEAVIYEVNNTFGERTHYVLAVSSPSKPIFHSCSKEMFVSPFFDMQGSYNFRLVEPGKRVHVTIDYCRDDEISLRAVFSGERKALNSANLAWLALRYFGTTLKVISAIHWQAFKLWLKGVPMLKHIPMERPSCPGGQT